jgi:radical SAM superfamily enzyme YgiQ (UPF0313 family)
MPTWGCYFCLVNVRFYSREVDRTEEGRKQIAKNLERRNPPS